MNKCTIILTPVYHITLSSSLMLIAIYDVLKAKELNCYIIYAGGDDIVALAPIERVIDFILASRSNYWTQTTAFHGRGGIKVTVPIIHGRSYGVRFSHVMDPMQTEIDIATKLLDDYAKETTWYICGKELRKDTLAISYGRTSLGELVNVIKLPLSLGNGKDLGYVVELLKNFG